MRRAQVVGAALLDAADIRLKVPIDTRRQLTRRHLGPSCPYAQAQIQYTFNPLG